MIGIFKREAERDFDKFIKYVKRLEEQNKKLKIENMELKTEIKKLKNRWITKKDS